VVTVQQILTAGPSYAQKIYRIFQSILSESQGKLSAAATIAQAFVNENLFTKENFYATDGAATLSFPANSLNCVQFPSSNTNPC
jgi:hypothetical protein